jgi:hypothetical protein
VGLWVKKWGHFHIRLIYSIYGHYSQRDSNRNALFATNEVPDTSQAVHPSPPATSGKYSMANRTLSVTVPATDKGPCLAVPDLPTTNFFLNLHGTCSLSFSARIFEVVIVVTVGNHAHMRVTPFTISHVSVH